MEVLIPIAAGYVVNEVEKIVLKSISAINKADNSSYLAWNNDKFSQTLNTKSNSFYELTYKHTCNNPQITFDNVKKKLYQIDVIDAVSGTTYKKKDKIAINDIVAISWITNLVILPFNVYSNVFYNVVNVYETENYLNLILQSTASSYNNECFSFVLTKDAQSVSITMTYNYVPMNVYYSFLISTKLLEYDPVIYKFMLDAVSHLFEGETITCDNQNIKTLTRGF